MHERSHGESFMDLMAHRFGGTILEIADGEIDEVPYDAAEPVALTRNFLSEPDRFLRHLLD